MSGVAANSISFTHLHVRRTPMWALSTCRWVDEIKKIAQCWSFVSPVLHSCFGAGVVPAAPTSNVFVYLAKQGSKFKVARSSGCGCKVAVVVACIRVGGA